MKKLITLILSFVFVLCLAACSKNNSRESITLETQNSVTSELKESGKKKLVVYYSASGSTKDVANVIADTIGGDLFELEPINPYNSDDLNWRDDNNRVTKEYRNENERDVKLVSTVVNDWSEYDTVFIGYPI